MANDLVRLISAIHNNRDDVLGALPVDSRSTFEGHFQSLALAARDHPSDESGTLRRLFGLLDLYPPARNALYAADPNLPSRPFAPGTVHKDIDSGTQVQSGPAPSPPTPDLAPSAGSPWITPHAESPPPPERPGAAPAQGTADGRSTAADRGQSSVGLQWVRELTTTVLAVLIVGFTLWIAATAVGLVGDDAKAAGIKDLLTILLGPAGVVIGYYFGRVPAEAHAADATRQAESATAERNHVRTEARQAARDLEIIERASFAHEARGELIPTLRVADLQVVKDRLRAL